MKVKKIAFEIGKAVIIVGALRVGEEVLHGWKIYHREKETRERRRKAKEETLENLIRDEMYKRLREKWNDTADIYVDPKVELDDDGEVETVKFTLKMK